ncbi:PPOX class F420-dependent oxidoreductase [Streptomyces sp. NPDC044780]|uniref:PPOX class F420-dependent oxidoreductase n=1 Tax=unclassified Streptomyces TaxID=2593676 RepID=UPI0022A83432|nr:PPOX class F420-dependent oxidoreductase [Streptomyces sp. S465]WAP60494.1 PPOX class F420-dependent oxidoreductase [Streptomyces sp. S465]
MPHPMSDDELVAFLTAEPARTATLATVRPDGRPHAAPVWFTLDRTAATPESPLGDIVITTGAASVKGRALRRDPRVALCIDDERPPFSFVSIEGTVTLSEEPEELLRWATASAARYMGADLADEIGKRIGGPGTLLVRVHPTHIVAVADLTD